MQTDSRGVPVEDLGDGVYVADMGFGIELRANNHEQPTDRVWFDNDAVGVLAWKFFRSLNLQAGRPAWQ